MSPVPTGEILQVEVARSNRGVTVRLEGELDLADRLRAERALRQAGERESLLVIDLTGLTFIGSVGVSVLLEADRRRRAAGEATAFLVGDGPARRVFGLLGVDAEVDIIG